MHAGNTSPEASNTRGSVGTRSAKGNAIKVPQTLDSGWGQAGDREGENEDPDLIRGPGLKKFGGDLLSHTGTRAVPSALKSLTSVFGMGTGVSSSL